MTKNQKHALTAKETKLLERVFGMYSRNFNDKCQDCLEKLGVSSKNELDAHQLGFCNGRLKETLPSSGEIIDGLKKLGILNGRSKEYFHNCIVFPVFDMEDNITTLYGYNIKTSSGKFLPGRSGIWNIHTIENRSEVIVTGNILDALSIEKAGYPNVISIHDADDLTPYYIEHFNECGIQKLILVFKDDKSGKETVRDLKNNLKGFSIQIKYISGEHSANSYLVKFGAKKLSELIKSDADTIPAEPEPIEADLPHDLSPEEEHFTLNCGKRSYKIMGLQKGVRKLKATVRLEHAGKLHVDTLDFYSAKARKNLEKDICRIFGEIPENIEADITRILIECEKTPVIELENKIKKTYSMTDEERKEAEKLGKSKNLIKTILSDFEVCGLIGEEANKLLGYIAMTSRKLDEPLPVMILSGSGAGKSALQNAVVSFCPPEDLIQLTTLSGKALFYKDRNSLKHKVLAIEEIEGAEDASYAIRNLISSGMLISESTIKDFNTGKLVTMENKVEGPTAVFYTTTNPLTDPETMSRFFITGVDESRKQTKKILSFQRRRHMKDSVKLKNKIKAVLNKHWNFQRLLNHIAIKNPFANKLTYKDERLQGRRDQPKYLNLIMATAFLRQMQKHVKHKKSIPYIDVDIEDIKIANNLANEILGRSLDELSRPGRDLLILLDDMVEKMAKQSKKHIERTEIIFSRRDIREYAGWSNSRVHRYLKELVELEYVFVDSGQNGSKYCYRLAYEGQGKEGENFVLGLTDVNNLMQKAG